MIFTKKNKQKYITATDRYGTTYVKNFFISPEPNGWNIAVQRWTSKDTKVKTRHLKHIERS